MTYGEANEFIAEFLRGDNNTATVTPIHFKMAIMEISTLCVPSKLKVVYDGTQTDVFRMLPVEEVQITEIEVVGIQPYIKYPSIPSTLIDTDDIPIDTQLALAVVFYICSYFSNKYSDRFESKAKKNISVYVSNIIA